MAHCLHLDFETRSTVDLKTAGVYVYAANSTTDVWCAAYAFDDGLVQLWRMEEPCPADLRAHVERGGEIAAWNAAFERIIWRGIMGPRYGWPVPRLEQYRCVMVESLAMSLPGALEDAAPALGLDVEKDQAGKRLMLQMARPRRDYSVEEARQLTPAECSPDRNIWTWRENGGLLQWWGTPDRRERLYAYCKQDVLVEREIEKRLLRLRPSERELWFLDQKINDRGVFINRPLCHAAKRIVADAAKALDQEMKDVTGGAVSACSNVSGLVAFLKSRGVDTNSVAKSVLEDLLALEMPADARRALELRKEAAKTSTAKIDAMLARCSADERMRGNLQFHGAGTGRWAGRGAQLQNLPRPSKANGALVDAILSLIALGDAAAIDLLYGNPLQAVSDCIRGLITAGPSRELADADFSNIEGRVIAWLAGEETKLKRFRDFDAGIGPDIYLVAASNIYNVDVSTLNEKSPERQPGKVSELALGFQGGPVAFAKMGLNYGLKVETVYDPVWKSALPDNRERALKGWDQRGRKTGMSKKGWIAAELIKLAWRQAHPRIGDLWWGLENAAVKAVSAPGSICVYRSLAYKMSGPFLFCRLPNGRCLCYPYPRIEEKTAPWGDKVVGIVYKSVDQFSRKWTDKSFYGGLAAENVTQAVARDVMAEAMQRVEAARYEAVLTVHDEVICEVPAGFGSLDEFNALMSELPIWATGLPIAAAGWRGPRYRK